jgi:hypothetical protein
VHAGARDGIEHSNSYFFEKNLGWKGLLAEAIPSEHGNISSSRPNSAIIDGGICETDGKTTFHIHKLVGWHGQLHSYDQERRDSLTDGEMLEVRCLSLKTLVALFGVHRVNFMSVDTEGSELHALKSFPWGRVPVDLISVESLFGSPQRDAKEQELVQYMSSVGYKVVHNFDFASDTRDIFFAPKGAQLPYIQKEVSVMYDNVHFERMKFICKALRTCL